MPAVSHEERRQRHREAGQSWKTCFAEPTDQWSQRKCNIYLHTAAAILCFVTNQPGCDIPLGLWLSVQFIFLILEGCTVEMRERMASSVYWSENRTRKKWIIGTVVALKEVSEVSWQIYGATLYFSKQADGCSSENSGLMVVFVLFLILGAFKLILVLVVLGILAFVAVSDRLRRRRQKDASKDILRSLAKIKYSALSIGQNEPDEECAICFTEYGEDDIVTKLSCNEKHIYHEVCIAQWIKQGKNSCPACRAPINADI